MNWVGVALPWINGLLNGVPLIVATTGFDRDREISVELLSTLCHQLPARSVSITFHRRKQLNNGKPF